MTIKIYLVHSCYSVSSCSQSKFENLVPDKNNGGITLPEKLELLWLLIIGKPGRANGSNQIRLSSLPSISISTT